MSEEQLRRLLVARAEYHRKYQRDHYRLARNIGFTSSEARIMQNWSEKRIRLMATERAINAKVV